MSLPRFFIDAPSESFILGERFMLPQKAARHAGRALRLAAGEYAELFNGTGFAWQGPVGFAGDEAWVTLETQTERTAESPLSVTLLQSFVAPEKTDWIVEKAVETGITAVVFVPAERSVTRLTGDRLAKRLARLTDITRSAAEQCGRNAVPSVSAAASLAEGLKAISAEARFVLAPGAQGGTAAIMKPGLSSAAFAVGPEGGFSPKELQTAQDAGWTPLLIGPRVLRTETAGLAAAVWAQTLAGDFPRAE